MLAVLAFVLAAKWGQDVDADFDVPSGKPAKTALNQPSKVKSSPSPTNVETNALPQATNAETLQETWLGQPVVKHEHRTNGPLVVETIYTSDGKKHKYYHDERENILPSAADQMLALMTAPDDGYGAPPLPHIGNFEDAFGEALKKEIVINATDSDEVKELKRRVIAARQELLGLMAEGVNANDIIEEYKKTQEDNSTIRLDAARGVQELLDAGDIEAARELCSKYNEVLENANIMPIEIPEEYLNTESKQ